MYAFLLKSYLAFQPNILNRDDFLEATEAADSPSLKCKAINLLVRQMGAFIRGRDGSIVQQLSREHFRFFAVGAQSTATTTTATTTATTAATSVAATTTTTAAVATAAATTTAHLFSVA